MALVNANTYVEPTAATSLTTARLQYNNSLRSLLTNFSSTAAPASVNMTASGNPFNVPNGTLYRSETNHALYVSDSDMVKNSPVGGNFTRIGLGNRVENGIVALGANAQSYEIGELVATVSENGSLAANSRLYLVTANALTNGSTVNFLDIGAPQGYSIGVNDNVLFSGQQVLSPRIYATTNLAVGTTTPDATLTVAGVAKITGNLTVLSNVVVSGNVTATSNVTASNVKAVGNVTATTITASGTATATTVTATGNMNAVNVTASSVVTATTVNASGNITAINVTASGDVNTTSDRKVKTNIVPIDNALAKAIQIEGVYYNRIGEDVRKVGVIAQDIERILPEVVTGTDLKSVSYGNIVGLLIEAIKELNKEVQELKGRIK
jgi:hypothetical protein